MVVVNFHGTPTPFAITFQPFLTHSIIVSDIFYFLLANDLLCGEYSSVIFQVAGVHGGGSPIMEDIAILGSYDMRKRINIAKHLAGIEITDDDKK